MKKFSFFAALIATVLTVASTKAQAVNTNFLNFQFSAVAVATTNYSPTPTTNTAGTASITYRAVTNIITTADILKMLATEYGTNFPTGAKLVVQVSGGSGGFKVVNSAYQVILDVSSNFTISNNVATGGTYSGDAIFGKFTENTGTTNSTENYTYFIGDTALYYHDSHGNNFHVVGIETRRENNVYNSTGGRAVSSSRTIAGTGAGTFYSLARARQMTGVFLRATASASGLNLVLDPN